MVRRLPDEAEARRILAAMRTRPMPGPPPVAGRALTGPLKALEHRFGEGMDALQARWREVVGAELARRTEPVKLIRPRLGDSAVLEIRVEGPSAAIVQHRASDLIARVNLFLGPGVAGKLRIVQGPLRGPARRHSAPLPLHRRRLRAPLDAAAEQRLADSLRDLPEGRLKDALLRLGREVLRDDGP